MAAQVAMRWDLPIIRGLFNGNAPQALLEPDGCCSLVAVAVPQQLNNVLTQLDRGRFIGQSDTYNRLSSALAAHGVAE